MRYTNRSNPQLFYAQHRYSVSCVWRHESCSTLSHVTTSVVLCENYIGCQSVKESYISCFLVHKASLGQSPDYISALEALRDALYKYTTTTRPTTTTTTTTTIHHGHAPASRGHSIPVLTAGRQSRRLRRTTDKPENGGSSIFCHRTESVEPAAD